MTFVTLTPEMVVAIHDKILNPGELPGRALGKSPEGALARVENRLAYGMIEDAFDLSATYCVANAQGHCVNDGNERTAFRTMQTILNLHGIMEPRGTGEMGQIIIRAAQRQLDEGERAQWLRRRA